MNINIVVVEKNLFLIKSIFNNAEERSIQNTYSVV